MFGLFVLFTIIDRPALALLVAAIVLALALICVFSAIAWIGLSA